MNDKEKKAFVARMEKGKREAAKALKVAKKGKWKLIEGKSWRENPIQVAIHRKFLAKKAMSLSDLENLGVSKSRLNKLKKKKSRK